MYARMVEYRKQIGLYIILIDLSQRTNLIMTLYDVKQLKDEFPKETEGFTLEEINSIWLEFSDSLAAGWIIPHKEDVRRVFNNMR